MARPAYSDDQVDSIQREIREVALGVFRQGGMGKLTLRAIARKMGCSAAALYRYYASKDDLLTAIRAEGFARMGSTLEEARCSASDSRNAARAAMRAYLGFALEEPEVFRLMYELSQGDAQSAPTVRVERERAFSQARVLAEEAIEAGWLEGDANLAAHLLWVGCHGLATLAMADQLDLGCSYDELVEPLLARLISG
jgi:AcrR family transcriptional regulator